MKYVTIKRFTDLQDGNHPYNVGDTFPREGLTVTDSRLQELSTTSNRRGIPLIEAVDEDNGKGIRIVEGHFDKKALSAMRNDDLSKLATDLGLDVSECKVKADFVDLLAAVEVEDGSIFGDKEQ